MNPTKFLFICMFLLTISSINSRRVDIGEALRAIGPVDDAVKAVDDVAVAAVKAVDDVAVAATLTPVAEAVKAVDDVTANKKKKGFPDWIITIINHYWWYFLSSSCFCSSSRLIKY
ncbi:unnamed protein product [Lathyrus sativus]|nr:unnamed protein product [Lathyrus sativus]